MTTEDIAKRLTQVCYRRDIRVYIRDPFWLEYHGNKYMAATNGHMMVLVPVGEFDDTCKPCWNNAGVSTILDEAFSAAPSSNTTKERLGKWAGSPRFLAPDCESCRGTDEVTCNECDGDGSRECDMGHQHDCEECDGHGTMRCPVHDRIEWNPAYGKISGVLINRVLVARAVEFMSDGEVAITIRTPTSSVGFRDSKGVIAAIMPMRADVVGDIDSPELTEAAA